MAAEDADEPVELVHFVLTEACIEVDQFLPDWRNMLLFSGVGARAAHEVSSW